MNIAIHNFHEVPNLFNLGIHNYIINLIKSRKIRYLYFDLSARYLSIDTVIKIRHYWIERDKIQSWGLPWEDIEFIFSSKELDRKCDVLLNFNSHLGETQFTKAVKNFSGLKVYHVNDYFWNQPGTQLNKYLTSVGVDYLMGYSSHDKHCEYFQCTFGDYLGKVIPVPFGFQDRFSSKVNFNDRKNKCVALGSVNHLRPLDANQYNYRESADFFPDEAWFHKFRRLLVLNHAEMSTILDSMLPVFPEMKDFRYDIVDKFNEYKMFVSCESIFNFPPAKTFEGPACGAALICADHECNREYGFKDQLNCIMYHPYDIDDLKDKIIYYMDNCSDLSRIQQNGEEFVRLNYSHEKVANRLYTSIRKIYSP